MAPRGNVTVPVAGEIVVGSPLLPSSETVSIPRKYLEKDELVYRVTFALHHIPPQRLAIAELRDSAATEELVIARFEEKIYVGRWWAKHGARELVVDDSLEPMQGVTILAVVNLILAI